MEPEDENTGIPGNNTVNIAYMNICGQTGLNRSKQRQIEEFLKKNNIDILNCQEINVEEDTFAQCPFITSNYSILPNNAINKYGTAVLIKNEFIPENIKMDTNGRAIKYDFLNLTFGNIYLPSGTDGVARAQRENFISEIIPMFLVNRKDCGILGGDFNCITNREDCTKNPESKMSPSLKRLISTFRLCDTFRYLHPATKSFSRYYARQGQEGATRIDRSYHWGEMTPVAAWYESIAFSDHMVYNVKLTLPSITKLTTPKSKPFFKTKPEVVKDVWFKNQLEMAMVRWQEVLDRGLPLLDWWELIVKPGIKRLAIGRLKEIKRQKRGKLNMLLLKQSYFTRKMQEGNLEILGQLKEVQVSIMEWYEEESSKIVLQSRVEDVQESEKVRIFHHEQHAKHIRKSSILKLDTEDQGLLEGHQACADYLHGQVAELLLNKAVLDPTAQASLLMEVPKVFTEADNAILKKMPSKDEVGEILKLSNLNAAPGTDGITSLLYQEHWDILGDSLHKVTSEIWKGQKTTTSQRTSLMVFGAKPSKPRSILPGDKRRISLMNADIKIVSSLTAARFRKTQNHTLHHNQLVAGDDRLIHHGINKARDCIQAISKSGRGCALLDLDFIAAFDFTVFDWVFSVLRKKGLDEEVISNIRNIYESRVTIPVINNMPGRGISNNRGTLAQGCPSSMNWFGYAIDPLLIYLDNRLEGIPIYSLPVHGPAEERQARPPPLVEKYKVYGLADDIKPGVSNMFEFAVVERAAKLFERSSGNQLHRDPVKGKCKVLLLGRWKGMVEQEDIGYRHLRITDSLAFVGVHLQATWQKTRKQNNDELIDRVKGTVGAWKSGKFMPLICRPFSLNSYALSKVWFRTHSVDMRAGDISTLASLCKSYMYQDMLEKPSELVLYRKVEHGGLGLHNIKCKALASLISTFLQTAVSPRFQKSLYHNVLYRFYCLGEETLPKPDYPPYYNQQFFNIIKKVKEKTPMNPIHMTVKEWYNYLLEEEVTMEVVDDEGRKQAKLCRVELQDPTNDWSNTFDLARVRGLSTETRSFCFKLIHQLLPVNERLHQLLPNNSSHCPLCPSEEVETPLHRFFGCVGSSEAAKYILDLIRPYDPTISEEKCLILNITTDALYELPTMLVLGAGLNLIWGNRTMKKRTTVHQTRAEIECLVSLLRKSRNKKLREAGNIISNSVNIFG